MVKLLIIIFRGIMTKRNITQEDIFGKEHYMVCEFPYHCQFIIPYAIGAKIIELLGQAEVIETSTYDATTKPPILSTDKAIRVESVRVSKEDYRKAKMSALLGLTEPEVG
jgi:hypothetical protein